MTTRQIIEIVLLAIVCVASLRTWFWKGIGLTPQKKLGIVLALIAFLSISALILSGH